MTCDDIGLLLAANAVGGLDPGEVAVLRRHLEQCAHCRLEGGAYLHVATMLAEAVPPLAPPARLRSRLLAQVQADAAGEVPARGSIRLPWYRRLWRVIPVGRPFTLGAALCSAAAVAVAVWSFSVPHGASGVAIRVPACGAAAAANASCLLVYDAAAHQALVTVDGLAAPPVVAGTPLQTYELWLISANGRATPAALLTRRPGTTEWSAAIPIDISGYTALAATAESSPQGVLTPQGPEILRMSLPPLG